MAKNDDIVLSLARKVVVFDKRPIADIMAAHGIYKEGASAQNNVYKSLVHLVSIGKLEKLNGFFRVKGCKSEYGIHSQILTRTLAEILKVFPESLIFREHTIHEVGLRPDALALLTKGGKGLCLWIEVCNHEHPDYFEKKKNALKSWDALPYLSRLFNYLIPSYHFVKDTELTPFLEEKLEEDHG